MVDAERGAIYGRLRCLAGQRALRRYGDATAYGNSDTCPNGIADANTCPHGVADSDTSSNRLPDTCRHRYPNAGANSFTDTGNHSSARRWSGQRWLRDRSAYALDRSR